MVMPAGRLLIIGGGEDRCCGAGVLERFVELSGGDQTRITLVTTATGIPDEVHAAYEQVFRKLGVGQTRELRLRGRADADSDAAATVATWFSRVVVYEDRDLRGREAGEMTRLISGALARHRPDIRVWPADGPEDALRSALALAALSDPVLLTYEKLDPVRDLLAGLGATGWPA